MGQGSVSRVLRRETHEGGRRRARELRPMRIKDLTDSHAEVTSDERLHE